MSKWREDLEFSIYYNLIVFFHIFLVRSSINMQRQQMQVHGV